MMPLDETWTDEEIIKLLTQVRDGEMTVDEAVEIFLGGPE